MTRRLRVRHQNHITFIVDKGSLPPRELMLTKKTWLKLCRVVCKMDRVISSIATCHKMWHVTRALRIVANKKRHHLCVKIVGWTIVKMTNDDWKHLVDMCIEEVMRHERRKDESKQIENVIERLDNLSL